MRKIVTIGVALACGTAFLLLVLAPGGCTFNLLPYEIHESIFKGGSGESQFIRIFDILFSIGLFFFIYWIMNKIASKKAKPFDH